MANSKNKYIILAASAIMAVAIIFFLVKGLFLISFQNKKGLLQEETAATSKRIEWQIFRCTGNALDLLTGSKDVRDILEGKGEKTKVRFLFDSIQKLLGSSIIFVIDKDATALVCTTDEAHKIEGQNYSFRVYYQDMFKKDMVIYPGLGVTTGVRGIYCSAPVKDPESGKVIGGVVIKLSVDSLDKQLKEAGKKLNSEIVILSSNGIVFASTRKEWLYHSILPLGKERVKKIKDSLQFAGMDIKELPFTLDTPELEISHVKNIFAEHPFANTGWKAVFFRPEGDELYFSSDTKFILTNSAIALFLLIVVIIFLGINIHKRRIMEKALRASRKALIEYTDAMSTFNARLSIDGKIVWVSMSAVNVGDLSREELCGMPLKETPWWNYDPKPQERLSNALEKAVKGEHISYAERVKIINDEIITISFHLHPIRGESGKVEYLIAEGTDITNLLEAENALLKSEENLRITIDSIKETVIATDMQGNIVRVNQAGSEMLGRVAGDILGKALKDVLTLKDPDSGEDITNIAERIIEKKESIILPEGTILTDSNENELRISCTGTPVMEQNTQIIGTVFVARDITEKLRIERQLQQSEKMDSIGQLASGVAHDFNNMLGGILGYADLLRERVKDELLRDFATQITEAASSASELANKLLTFSRKKEFQNLDLDIHKVLRDTIGLLKHSIDKRISIETKFDAKETFVKGDAPQLQNIMLNLCVNARDAMPDGGKITISTENIELAESFHPESAFRIAGGDYILISVQDTGTGIPKSIQKKIFEPFFTTKEEGKGTGLGLSAVYKTIQTHKGAVTVYSEEGKGTIFHIYLPLIKIEPFETVIKKDKQEKRTITDDVCILLVDDEQIMRSTASSICEQLGYKTILGRDGKEGLDLYRKHKEKINFVILDMVMPELNGKECFQAIKALNPKAKIFLSSGFPHIHEIDILKKQGLCGFLRKPYRSSDIKEIVEEFYK